VVPVAVKDQSAQAAPPARPGRFGWRPQPALIRGFALAAVFAQGGIAVTGATVRVTGSGLGCATWPECQPGSLIPESRSGLSGVHQAIEFSNRTLTGVVLIAALGTFALLLLARPQRPGILKIAAAGPIGVLFQAVWGGIVVHTELSWWTVAPHMLVSLVLLFFAIWLHQRLVDEARSAEELPAARPLARPLVVLTWVTTGVLLALCVAGTLVTAAGPHAGDVDTPRLGWSVRTIAQVHADLMFLYLGLVVALAVAVIAVKAPQRLQRRLWVLVAVTAAQGLIGLVQYATGVPEALVVSHVLGAVLLTAAAARVTYTASRGR